MNLLQRYERRRKWTAWFLWAVGISLALLVVLCAETHTFTIGAPVIVVLVALAGFCILASGNAASDPKAQAVRREAEEHYGPVIRS
jgi:peptidoglycan/LPS O-acetylase OafA/YrhL